MTNLIAREEDVSRPNSLPVLVVIWGATLALYACATPAVGQEPAAARARRTIDEMIASSEVPGLQYQVLSAEGVLFSAAAGVREVCSAAPMEAETLQMAYSTTKVITAVAVMQLVERGMLALDAPLTRYYARHPYGGEITVRQLLAHTSGVPDPMPLDWLAVEGQAVDRDAELHRLLARHPRLRHAPGRKYGYSNLSYWLLEKAIEGVTGEDYASYVDEHIFRPLGVSPATARFTPAGDGTRAVGYARRFSAVTWTLEAMTPSRYWDGAEGRWVRSAPVLPYGRGYGGLMVTAGALGRVLQDLLRPDSVLLGPASKEALFAEQRTTSGGPAGALGWVVGQAGGERYFGKQGGGLGFHGNVRLYPARGLATVLLANGTEISAGPIDARSDALDAIFLAVRKAPAPAR